MKELKFVCVEDDSVFMDKIVKLIQDYYHKQGYIVSFDVFNTIPSHLKVENVVACFFDIEVKNGDTLQLIKELRDKGIMIPIIIISQYNDYVFETVHMQIFDYIRKAKFDEEVINMLLKLDKVIQSTMDHIIVNHEGRCTRIDFKDILYVHVESHKFTIHFANGKRLIVWKNYDDVFIKNSTLLRTHKSYVININYCISVSKYRAVLKGMDEFVPISIRNYNDILNSFVLKHSLVR